MNTHLQRFRLFEGIFHPSKPLDQARLSFSEHALAVVHLQHLMGVEHLGGGGFAGAEQASEQDGETPAPGGPAGK